MTAIEIMGATLSIGMASLVWGYHRISVRLRNIENRDWPTKVVEWRTLELSNCRCSVGTDVP
jgi:hypothetical protein